MKKFGIPIVVGLLLSSLCYGQGHEGKLKTDSHLYPQEVARLSPIIEDGQEQPISNEACPLESDSAIEDSEKNENSPQEIIPIEDMNESEDPIKAEASRSSTSRQPVSISKLLDQLYESTPAHTPLSQGILNKAFRTKDTATLSRCFKFPNLCGATSHENMALVRRWPHATIQAYKHALRALCQTAKESTSNPVLMDLYEYNLKAGLVRINDAYMEVLQEEPGISSRTTHGYSRQ